MYTFIAEQIILSNIISLVFLLKIIALDFSQFKSLIKKKEARETALSLRFVHAVSFTKRYQ